MDVLMLKATPYASFCLQDPLKVEITYFDAVLSVPCSVHSIYNVPMIKDPLLAIPGDPRGQNYIS